MRLLPTTKDSFTHIAPFTLRVAVLMLFGFCFSASAQAAITVTRVADLSFGFVVAGSGSVIISASGARSASGGAVLFNQGSGATGQAAEFQFNITGEQEAEGVCTIELPSNIIYLAGNPNGAVNSFTLNRNSSIQLSGGAASGSFKVGGTLSLSGLSARSQAYSSNFTVTITCP